MMFRPISSGLWDLPVLSTCRTPSDMGWLSLTAASGSDSAQSMLQQHQSHLPRCLQACLAEQQPVWQNNRLGVVSTPSHQSYWQGPVAQCQCLPVVTSTYMSVH